MGLTLGKISAYQFMIHSCTIHKTIHTLDQNNSPPIRQDMHKNSKYCEQRYLQRVLASLPLIPKQNYVDPKVMFRSIGLKKKKKKKARSSTGEEVRIQHYYVQRRLPTVNEYWNRRSLALKQQMMETQFTGLLQELQIKLRVMLQAEI